MKFANWKKSSHSATGQCVEQGVATDGSAVGVRDTKQEGQGPVLTFAPEAWAAFIADVKASDRLANLA